MSASHTDATEVILELKKLAEENARLKAEIASLKSSSTNGRSLNTSSNDEPSSCPLPNKAWEGVGHGLTKEEIARYSRQIILPSFGVQAQARLCKGSVLVIGAGGLGSPALLYLAAAGVGRIGIVDRDAVELSNIHRQVIHTEASVGTHKSLSAAEQCKAINSSITIETHLDGFGPENAVELVSRYDVIVDASDNAPTRYLISDACAVTKKPLVSGAAIGTDGQLTVYCYGDDGPCYRCLFPVAPPATSCARCVDAGVLGVIPGIIGTLQALEAIKILTKLGEPMFRKLLLMDGMAARFHMVKLRPRSAACVACGDIPSITRDNLAEYDYQSFTGQKPNDGAPTPISLLDASQRVSPSELRSLLDNGRAKVVVDVRPSEQFNICHLPGAVHAPYGTKFDAMLENVKGKMSEVGISDPSEGVYVVCRRGNDSQRAVVRMEELGLKGAMDMVGGMEGWAREVDSEFPVY